MTVGWTRDEGRKTKGRHAVPRAWPPPTKFRAEIWGVGQVAVEDKASHTVGARLSEWLVFRKSALSLDQTLFNYQLIAKVSDGHLHLTMERMGYLYEMDRTDTKGMETKAEEWITDEWALNKKGNKLSKYSGKFRCKTIDRKDNIFGRVCKALGVNY